MELKWIKTFIAAAKTENFRKASEELYISQSSVTIHIQLLEKYLNCSLFQREGKKVKLTDEGKFFLPYAQKLIHISQEGIRNLNRFKQGFSRKLTLGISPFIAELSIPSILNQYVQEHPEVEIEVQLLKSKDIIPAIMEEKVDLGLSRLHVHSSELSCKVLAEDRLVLVVPPAKSAEEKEAVRNPGKLFENKLLLTHNHPEYWDRLLSQIHSRYRNVRTMVVSQVGVTKRFIEEGLGISFLPEIAVRKEVQEGRLLSIECPEFELPTMKTYVIMKHGNSQGEHFLKFLSQFSIS
ncbi:LysR family transcriptional regulator [Fictibacillus sp. Mic-4]|uniref:LysR family transcriptional regulator n=1 Tax=Fictibacillus TaxID=1329200 RepID=UPI000420FA13|nr:LysR family transcriptional regulator [Fictibacillus gelatini]